MEYQIRVFHISIRFLAYHCTPNDLVDVRMTCILLLKIASDGNFNSFLSTGFFEKTTSIWQVSSTKFDPDSSTALLTITFLINQIDLDTKLIVEQYRPIRDGSFEYPQHTSWLRNVIRKFFFFCVLRFKHYHGKKIDKVRGVEIVKFSTCPGASKKPKCTCP